MHLFIVSDVTLPIALKYGFVGTKLKRDVVPWGEARMITGS
jgi:hypothetical protein